MHRIVKALALSTLGLVLSTAAQAEAAKTIATLTCTGGNSPYKANVYAYNFDTGLSSTRYFSVYLPNSAFEPMELNEYFGAGWSDCSLSSNKGTSANNVQILDVDSVGAGVDVSGGTLSEDAIGQQYTVVYFSYTFLDIGPNVVRQGKPSTPEEEAAAYAAFRAKTALNMPRH
jgi:hypothetical protein